MPQELVELLIPVGAFFGGLMAVGLIAFICIMLIFSAFMLIFYTLAMMMGAKVVNIEGRTFGKALTATALNIFAGWVFVAVLAVIFPPLAIVAYFLLPCLFIKWIYECSFGKAILAAVLSYFAAISICLLLFIVTFVAFKLAPDKKKEEQTAKVKINENFESPILLTDGKTPLVEKVPVKETLIAKPLVKEPLIAKTPKKDPVKIKATPKKINLTKSQSKVQQIRPQAKSKNKPEVVVASKPKEKLKATTKKSPKKLANNNKS